MEMKEFYETGYGGRMPAGLPGGFFVYEATGDERILYAGPNVIKLYGCDSFEDFLDYTHGTFEGMVDPEDYHMIQNQIQAQTLP